MQLITCLMNANVTDGYSEPRAIILIVMYFTIRDRYAALYLLDESLYRHPLWIVPNKPIMQYQPVKDRDEPCSGQ